MRKRIVKSFVLLPAALVCLHLAAAGLRAQEAYRLIELKNPRCDLSEVPPLDPPPGGPFATTLRDTPEARGAIVVYGMQGAAEIYARDVKERLINFAGVRAERLVTVYGGDAEDLLMELWVIPKGAAGPKSDFVEDTKSARKFDSYVYWSPECGSGRPEALAEFAGALKQRAGWQGYVVARPPGNRRGGRGGDSGPDPDGRVSRREMRRRLARDRQYLVRKFGLPSERVRTVVGDDARWLTRAELWLVPPGAQPPTWAGAKTLR